MRRITPRTCLWPLVGSICFAFAFSIGLTYKSNHHCFAGTCGEWLFPLQARLHVVVWYSWLSTSIALLSLRAFQPWIRNAVMTPVGCFFLLGKRLRISGLLLLLWLFVLYGSLFGVWWKRLREYFGDRGEGLEGNHIVAAVAMTGHLIDVSMGMVLLPVSRHSALISFFKLSPSSAYLFHMTMAYILVVGFLAHGLLYAVWTTVYRRQSSHRSRAIFPVLNPTYLRNEVWPGNTSSLGKWRASLIFTGSAAALIMFVMIITSLPVVRRKHFNLFYFTHLLGILAIVIICLHASTMFYCTLPGLLMWLLDWSMRAVELKERIDGKLLSLGNGWYLMTLPLPRKRLSGCACHSPLAHFYIHHGQSSAREVHPFTTISHLASQKTLTRESGETWISIRFLFKASASRHPPSDKRKREWTHRLGSLADTQEPVLQPDPEKAPAALERSESAKTDTDITVRLEGPYFTPANPEHFKNVICLVAGSGLSGGLAIAAAFKASKRNFCEAEHGTGPACTMPPQCTSIWQRCTVVWTVREIEYTPMPFFVELGCEGLDFQVHRTGRDKPRMDPKAVLRQSCETHSGADSWCYISGPGGFIAAAERACSEVPGLRWFAARWD